MDVETKHASADREAMLRRFRERLAEVIARSELSQSAFAASVGIDRSTLSQLLSPANARLPRADSVVAIARAHGVSLDWLFGLSHAARPGTDLMAETLHIERDAPSPLDERLARWHEEAAGYKIRHVPSTLPDVLKTRDVIAVEYDRRLVQSPRRRIEITEERLESLRRPEADMEICTPVQTLAAFARGEGVWREVAPRLRRAQLERFAALTEELYPRLRWYLFDAREVFSVPVTIFGPLRVAIYAGQMYVVLRSIEHVRTMTQHFETLIRAAVVQPTGMGEVFARLLAGDQAMPG